MLKYFCLMVLFLLQLYYRYAPTSYGLNSRIMLHLNLKIPYFSAHCISDHRISNSNHIPDHECSHLLVRDAVVRNTVGRKGGHQMLTVVCDQEYIMYLRPTPFRIIDAK